MVFLGLVLNYTLINQGDTSKQCKIDLQQECILSNDDLQVSVQFLQAIEVEEELKLQIKIPEDAKVVQMWVQGVNMYMGKHAVLTDAIFAQNGFKLYQASLFLGACSESKMKWQLIIQTENSEEAKESWFFNFDTNME